MAAHRYWRLTIVPQSGSYTSCAELELRATVGGADQCSGGTASASSIYSGSYPASQAFDNNNSTIWASATTPTPHWLQYDFGAGNDKEVLEILFRIRGDSTPSQGPLTLALAYSDDGTTFTQIAWWFGIPSWTLGEARTFAVGQEAEGAYRYWRIVVTARQNTADTIVSMVEVELRATPGGSDATGSGTATADSQWDANNSAPKAVDNDTGTKWASARAALPHWWKYDFGAGNSVHVQEIYFLSRNDSYWTETPFDFTVQYSADDSTWTTAWTVKYAAFAQNVSGVFTDPAHAAADNQYIFWRLRGTAQSAPSIVLAAELEFRATEGGADQCASGAAYADDWADPSAPPSYGFDNNTGSEWQSSTTGEHWIHYRTPTKIAVQQVAYTTSSVAGTPTRAMGTFVVEASHDGITWTEYGSFSGQTWSLGETKLFSLLGEPEAPVIEAAGGHTLNTITQTSGGEGADTITLYGAAASADLPEEGAEGAAYQLSADWDGSALEDTGLGHSTLRYYRAYATNDFGTTASNLANATTDALAPPTAPVITAVATAPGTITVTMTSGGVGATTIALYGADDPDDVPEGGALPGADLLDADWDGTAFDETGLGPSHYRAYRAYATNVDGTTPSNRPSATTQALPGVPVLSLAADSATQITVTFATPGATADSHELWWGTDPDALVLYSDALPAAPSPIVFSDLEPVTTYYFQAVAVNETGETEGLIVSIATLAPALQVAYVTNTTAGLVLQYDPTAVKVQYQVALDAETDFDPTVDDDIETNEDDNNPFGHETTGLTASTWYRAWARSSATLGGAFGAWTPVVRFQTAAASPLVRMGGFTAPLSGAFLSGAQTLQWDLRTPTIYGELNIWVGTQLAVSEDGENWTILALEAQLTPAGPTGSWAINMSDYDASIVTFRIMGRRSDGKLGVAYRSFYNNDGDDPLTGTLGFDDECWEAMWAVGDGTFYRLHNPIRGEMEHTIYVPAGDVSFYLPCAQPDPLVSGLVVQRVSATVVTTALAKGGTFYWWLNEQVEGAGAAIDIYNGDGTLLATGLIRFMNTWPIAPCTNPDNLTGWVEVTFTAPVDQPGEVSASDASLTGQGRYPSGQCGVWGEVLILSVSIERDIVDHSLWTFGLQGATSKPNSLGETRRNLTGSFHLEGDICAAYVLFRSIGEYYDEVFNSGGVIMGAGVTIDYTGEPCEAPPIEPPESETAPPPFIPTLDMDVVVDCGDVTITGEFFGEQPGNLAYAELEIIRTDTDEAVYGPTQRVDGSEWFFDHTTHTLPYYIPLAARMRWSDGEALSEWSDWEAFILSIAWEDCLPIWWPSVEGVRRILFGEPGVTSDGLDIETTGIRRILFGEPGD